MVSPEFNLILERSECDGYERSNEVEDWILPDSCPIKSILSIDGPYDYNGIDLSGYTFEINLAQYEGYDDIPYFLFGTDQLGRDLTPTKYGYLYGSIFGLVLVTAYVVSSRILKGRIDK